MALFDAFRRFRRVLRSCQEGFKGKFDFLYLPIDFRCMGNASFPARDEVQGRIGLRLCEPLRPFLCALTPLVLLAV